ncbi:hypothetical protein SDC9_20415 [bioreactor metagenome]|uniref:Antitoxin SocA-like Panacea domain-containing protein n=1 Tax=bioreactor metagenome TaxID=1076179 RepID=A0A644U6M8_9ZZZZ|nr:Panacea domain-containing protein [Methanocorpusculum sp.]
MPEGSTKENGEFDSEKFKQVLLYIISKTEALPNVGKKVLYKLLYFADFNYYEVSERKLTGEVYAKLEHGPAPRHFNDIMEELKESHLVEEKLVPYYNHTQTRYCILNAPKMTLLSAEELLYVDETLDRYSSMNGQQIESLSHDDTPWAASELNDNLNYELVFYRSPSMSVREYCDDQNTNNS